MALSARESVSALAAVGLVLAGEVLVSVLVVQGSDSVLAVPEWASVVN